MNEIIIKCEVVSITNTTLGKGPKDESNVIHLNIHEYMGYFSNSIKNSPNYELNKPILDGYINWLNTQDASDYSDMVLLTLPGD